MIQGPFGIYPFPIINRILLLLTRGSSENTTSGRSGVALPHAVLHRSNPVVVNSEMVEWSDWKGRTRTMTIHRRIEQQ
jgi:hypothetical protein